jgi:selenocysteine lyase/cysteine desulfurase
MLDLEFVRRQFPAFAEPSLQGQAFFENAGGSYACAPVISRLNEYYRRLKVQPYYVFPASTEAGEWMDESRRRLGEYLGVASDEVHFGASTSQNTYVLAQAVRSLLKPGEEIIVTNQDHEANTGAWRRLASQGIVVKQWCVDPETGALDVAQLDQLLTQRTRLVSFPRFQCRGSRQSGAANSRKGTRSRSPRGRRWGGMGASRAPRHTLPGRGYLPFLAL